MLTAHDVLLKVAYSVVFFVLCIVSAYLHYVLNSADYNQVENVAKLNASTLNRIIDTRGIHKDKKILALERADLVELVTSTGLTYSSEIKNLGNNLTRRGATRPKVFNSAGELLESVEDSRGNVWIVQIVHSSAECGGGSGQSGALLSNATWLDLSDHLATFGIQTGTFNCRNDPFFCMSRGWDSPQLVLGLIKYETTSGPREFVELYQYNNCKLTSYDSIFSWVELVLRKRLLTKKLLAPEPDDHWSASKSSSNLVLDLYYMDRWNEKPNNNLPSKRPVPLYFSTLSVKYNNRARFHLADGSHMPECASGGGGESSTTPIYLMIDRTICYNYGANLNELPNYAHFDLFLLFLYPDMNVLFMLTFVFLNAHLIMVFFEYNESLLKQLLNGFIYLCIFNFILFTIWTLTTTSRLSSPVSVTSATCKHVLRWTRRLFMQHTLTQRVFAHIRYVAFFHIYVQPALSILFYLLLSLVYYFHTRRGRRRLSHEILHPSDSSLLGKILARKFSPPNRPRADSSFSEDARKTPIITLISQNRSTQLADDNESEKNAGENRNAPQSLTNRAAPQLDQEDQSVPSVANAPVRPPLEHDQTALATPFYDLDVEMSVSELIDQINGLTTIWLESSTHADRILSALPSIEYCKCFYINTVKIHNCDETDTDQCDGGTTTESDEPDEAADRAKKPESCACGRNSDLNKYLDENNIRLFDRIRRECSICLDKYQFGSLIKILPCGHAFHQRCIYEWFMNSVNYKCPVCRTCFYKYKKTN